MRSLARIRHDSGIRQIRVHVLRHTTASLLKYLSPPRDAPVILGHAHVTTTQQILGTGSHDPYPPERNWKIL